MIMRPCPDCGALSRPYAVWCVNCGRQFEDWELPKAQIVARLFMDAIHDRNAEFMWEALSTSTKDYLARHHMTNPQVLLERLLDRWGKELDKGIGVAMGGELPNGAQQALLIWDSPQEIHFTGDAGKRVSGEPLILVHEDGSWRVDLMPLLEQVKRRFMADNGFS